MRKITLLAMMLVLAFAVAVFTGCGGDDEKSSGGGGGGGTTTEQTDDSGDDSGGGKDVSDDPQVQAAVEQCEQAIDAQPALKDDTKADLKKICQKAASGDIKDAQEAAKEVCTKIVEDTVPEGAARDQATEACKSASGG